MPFALIDYFFLQRRMMMPCSFWRVSLFCCLAAVTVASAAHNPISGSHSNSSSNSTSSSGDPILLSALASTMRLDTAAGVTVSGLSSGAHGSADAHRIQVPSCIPTFVLYSFLVCSFTHVTQSRPHTTRGLSIAGYIALILWLYLTGWV